MGRQTDTTRVWKEQVTPGPIAIPPLFMNHPCQELWVHSSSLLAQRGPHVYGEEQN